MQDVCTLLIREASHVVSRTSSRRDLCQFFAAMGFTMGAEIGVWEGGFACQLYQAIPNLQLTCIDPWKEYAEYDDSKNNQERLDHAYDVAKARLEPLGAQILRMKSIEAARHIPDRSLDFVYIDGNHTRPYVLADLNDWTPKVRSGGIVAGHDYQDNPRKSFIQVKAAVDEFAASRGIRPLYVLAGDKSPSWFWVQP